MKSQTFLRRTCRMIAIGGLLIASFVSAQQTPQPNTPFEPVVGQPGKT